MTVTLEEHQYRWLEKEARATRMSKAEIVRWMIDTCIEMSGGEPSWWEIFLERVRASFR